MITTTTYLTGCAQTIVLVAGSLSPQGTTSAPMNIQTPDHQYEVSTSASNGSIICLEDPQIEDALEPSNEVTQRTICELRRISGLTWDQLRELFGVSRRTVHFWASGKSMNGDNARQLMSVFDAVSRSHASDASSTRALLFTKGPNGQSAFELLRENKIVDAIEILGAGAQRTRPNLKPLNTAAKEARKPLSPFVLMDSIEASSPTESRPGRAARTVRTKRDKT